MSNINCSIKCLSFLLAFAMIFGCVSVATVTVNGADQTARYEMSTQKNSDGTIKVTISLADNPGLISLRFKLIFDADVELVSISNSGLLEGFTTPSADRSSPYVLRWCDALAEDNNIRSGEIATVIFKVIDDRDHTVALEHIEARDFNGRKLAVSNSEITVSNKSADEGIFIAGDVDGDGSVSTKDANIIKRVISGVLIPTEDVLRLCDVNGDGSINTKDTNVIKRMISGILILTHKPL
ncbi:MAG: dockerin type I repeat-containing protein [Clostridia bacterium]|nr:dockerin type I repeat-containing protein [Clostridia bacterium]